MKPIQRLTGAAVASLAAVVLTPLAAHAQYNTHYDGTADTWVTKTASGHAKPSGDPTGDVARVTLSHGPRTITITVAITNFTRTPKSVWEANYLLSTSTHRTNSVSLLAQKGAWRGVASWQYHGPDDSRSCPGLKRKVDLTANKFTVTIPRTCVGSPRYVRAAVYVTHGDRVDDQNKIDTQYSDDAYSDQDGVVNHTYGTRMHRA